MTTDTFTATIFISGEIQKIKDVCRKFCLQGFCVTVTPTEYIYTGGSEAGAAIGLINYPRFISTPEIIKEKAVNLAKILMTECCQRSCSIVCTDKSEYIENPDILIPR